MGFENGRVLLAKFLMDPVAVSLHLSRGVADRVGEPGELGVHGTSLHEPPRDPESLGVKNKRLTDGDTGRDGDSLEFQHGGQRGRRQQSGVLAARVFVEVAFEKAANRLEGLPGIRPGRLHHQSGTRFSRQREHFQNALAVGPLGFRHEFDS